MLSFYEIAFIIFMLNSAVSQLEKTEQNMKYYSYTTVDIILIFTQVEYFESDSNEKL